MAPMLIRAKQVLDPLDDERIKVRFGHRSFSMTSSSSEHDGEVDTSTLPENILYGFFGDGSTATSSYNNCKGDEKQDSDDNRRSARSAHTIQTLRDLLNPYKKPDCQFRIRLYPDVIRAAHSLSDLQRSSGSGCYRRTVMIRLQDIGYNAGICKSRWEASGGLTAGSYEYIDILVENEIEKENVSSTRYVLDLEFRAEFEVARGTEEYKELVKELPSVMVGKGEELRGVVKMMGDAAMRSLKKRGLSVPPWRKSRYMTAKWLGPYRRTINPLQSSSSATAAVERTEVKRRVVGFTVTLSEIGTVPSP